MAIKLKKRTKKTVNPLVKNIIRILIKNNDKKKKRKRTNTRRQTKVKHQNRINPGPGIITFTPSSNTLIEAILKKDDKSIPLITKLVANINNNPTIEENLTNRQIVQYLNNGEYNKLKHFYPQIEQDLNQLEAEILDDKNDIILLNNQKDQLTTLLNNAQRDLENITENYNEMLRANDLTEAKNQKLQKEINDHKLYLNKLQMICII